MAGARGGRYPTVVRPVKTPATIVSPADPTNRDVLRNIAIRQMILSAGQK